MVKNFCKFLLFISGSLKTRIEKDCGYAGSQWEKMPSTMISAVDGLLLARKYD